MLYVRLYGVVEVGGVASYVLVHDNAVGLLRLCLVALHGEVIVLHPVRGVSCARGGEGVVERCAQCRNCPVAKGGKDKAGALAFVPNNELCKACKIVRRCYGDKKKSKRAIERTHYLHKMEHLIHRKVRVNGNGHTISVGFRKDANKHLFFDTFGRTKAIDKDDLAKLDTILDVAKFVKKSGLSKVRNDKIKRFYYYKAKVNSKTAYLNVAEEDYQRSDGKYNHKRYLYSITDKIK